MCLVVCLVSCLVSVCDSSYDLWYGLWRVVMLGVFEIGQDRYGDLKARSAC